MRKKEERTYAKNVTIDTTYQVKFSDRYQGQRLRDIRRGLHRMFKDILQEARGDLVNNDLGRVVIHHDRLHDLIVVALRPFDSLNVNVVMEHIEKVLNSHQELSVNDSLEITIEAIDQPQRSGRRPITSLQGAKNSIQIKKSLVTIDNEDRLCMSRAIEAGWAKLNLCTKEEWDDLTRYQKSKSNSELILKQRKVPESQKEERTKNPGRGYQLIGRGTLGPTRESERHRCVLNSLRRQNHGGERSTRQQIYHESEHRRATMYLPLLSRRLSFFTRFPELQASLDVLNFVLDA